MANPVPYERDYSFAGWQANNPSKPLPGDRVDIELDNVSRSVADTILALADIRRSDGQINNKIVHYDALDDRLRRAIVAAEAPADYADRAEAAAEAAEAAWNSFRGLYYGDLDADPTVDPLGFPPTEGDLYYNTHDGFMKQYISGVWEPWGASGAPLTGSVVASSISNNPQAQAEIAAKLGVLSGLNLVADLSVTPYGLRAHVVVDGYLTSGDGGGGSFKWVSDSVQPHDGGSVINPVGNSGAGRWIRIWVDKDVRVEHFGAVNKGSADDTDMINAAAAFVCARMDVGDNRRLVMTSRYKVTKSIVFNRPFMRIVSDAEIVVGSTSGLSVIPRWDGESSGRKCVLDLRRCRQSTFGNFYFRGDTGVSLTGVTPIGGSLGLFPADGMPSAPGQGSSNCAFGAVWTQGFDHFLYTPSLGTGWVTATVYAASDIVFIGRNVYQTTNGGTSTVQPVNAGISLNGLTFMSDSPADLSLSSDPEIAGKIVAFVASRPVVEGMFVVFGSNTYKVNPGVLVLPASAPTHKGSSATGGDGVEWVYIRPQQYAGYGTGLVIVKGFGREMGDVGIVASNTALDDSWIGSLRLMECHKDGFQINGGTVVWGEVFISPQKDAAKMRNLDGSFNAAASGANVGQVFGSYSCTTMYVAGEWAGGIVVGHFGELNILSAKPDADFKSARGCFIEYHPGATNGTIRIKAHPNAFAGVPSADFFWSDISTLVPGDMITWPDNGGGSAYVLDSVNQVADGGKSFVVIRQIGGGVPQAGYTVTDAHSHVATVQASPQPTLMRSGFIGVPDVNPLPDYAGGLLARDAEIRMPVKYRSMIPCRANRSSLSTGTNSQDTIVVRSADSSEGYLYRLQAGALVYQTISGSAGYVLTGARQLLVEEGGFQDILVNSSDDRIVLPTQTTTDVTFPANFAPIATRLLLRITNGGLASQLFYTGNGRPAIAWRNGTPVWAANGVQYALLVLRADGNLWDGILLAGRKLPSFILADVMAAASTAGATGPTRVGVAGGVEQNAYVFPANSAVSNVIAMWMPPSSWNRGPVTMKLNWGRASGATTFVITWGVQGVVLTNGASLGIAFGTEIDTTSTASNTDSIYTTTDTADVTIDGAANWAPGLPVAVRIRRRDDFVGDTLDVSAYLFAVTITCQEG